MKRFVHASNEVSSAMKKLISDVADDFYQTMQQEGFESFNDMKESYDWDYAEIKEEIEYMVEHLYKGTMYNNVVVANDDSEMSYKDFKKAVVAEIDLKLK